MDTPQPAAQELYDRGMALLEQGEYDQAITAFTRLLDLAPDHAPGYVYRGRCYDCKQDHDRALADFSAAIRADPGYALAYHFRGVSHAKKQEFDKALADYNTSLGLNPDDPGARNNRGSVLVLRGEVE